MQKYIHDLATVRKSVEECEDHIVIFDGNDVPRYVRAELNESGILGIAPWNEFFYKPTSYEILGHLYGTAGGEDNLLVDNTKSWENDELVGMFVRNVTAEFDAEITGNNDISIEYEEYISGTTTNGSIDGVIDSTASFTTDDVGKYLYNVSTDTGAVVTEWLDAGRLTAPGVSFSYDVAYELYEVFTDGDEYFIYDGTATGTTSGTLEDSTKSWEVNSLIGKVAKNKDTDAGAPITGNSANTITCAGVSFTSGDRYQILDGGSLEADKYYCFSVVPAKSSPTVGGLIIKGNATPISMPMEPEYGSGAIGLTLPLHPQFKNIELGDATDGSADTLSDSTKSWGTDELVGKYVFNVETDVRQKITANTGTQITAAGIDSMAGDRYYIQERECDARYIYGAVIEDEVDAITLSEADMYFVDIVEDPEQTEYVVKTVPIAGTTHVSNHFQPPNCRVCGNVNETIYCADGIDYEGESAMIDMGETEYTSSASANSEITVSIIDDVYDGAGMYRVARYTFGSAFDEPTYVAVGSRVTITGATVPGNNVDNEKVLRVGENYIDIYNNFAEADTDTGGMNVSILSNVIVSYEDLPAFTKGFEGATFTFDGYEKYPLRIEWVSDNKAFLGVGELIPFEMTEATSYTIRSRNDVYFSDYKNPHKYSTGNVVEVPGRVSAIKVINGRILYFCDKGLYYQPVDERLAEPTLVSDSVRCPAKDAVVAGDGVVMFYDGRGFSVTNGSDVQSITAYRASDYVDGINRGLESEIQGVYDSANKRFEFYFPYGNETNNNYGLVITEGSYNCYPVSRPDVNALWSAYEGGNRKVYHGTSGDFTSGAGNIWVHEGHTDNLEENAPFMFVVSEVDVGTNSILVVSQDGASSVEEGDTIVHYPESGTMAQMIVQSVELYEESPYSYVLTFSDAYSASVFSVGDTVLFGVIPFDYGIYWTDFSSPQYLHQPRALHVDVQGFFGKLYCEHYLNLIEAPVATEAKLLSENETKVVFQFTGGKGYTYGFRLRGYSASEFKIHSAEIVWDTQA